MKTTWSRVGLRQTASPIRVAETRSPSRAPLSGAEPARHGLGRSPHPDPPPRPPRAGQGDPGTGWREVALGERSERQLGTGFRATLLGALLALFSWVPVDADAQVSVIEDYEAEQVETMYAHEVPLEPEPEPHPADRSQGRGVEYGVHAIVPIAATPLRAQGFGRPMDLTPGFGLQAHVGWEFPSNFSVQIFGALAGHGIENQPSDLSNVMLRADVGLSARYSFFNETAVVPFVQAQAVAHYFIFEQPAGIDLVAYEAWTASFGAGGGVQLEISRGLGIEAGATIAFLLPGEAFAEGGLLITPFLGLVFYAD